MKNAHLTLVTFLLVLAGCHHAGGIGFTSHMPEGRPPFAAGSGGGLLDLAGRARVAPADRLRRARRFHGIVESVDGSVAEVRPIGTRRGVSPGEDAIAFDWESAGTEQAFDWAASDDCARFDIYIDDDARPLRVFLGGGEQSPARVPFAVCR